MATVSQGDLIELEIEKFADKGKSLARVDGYVVFVEGAVPGDHVKAYVHRTKSSHAEAKLDTLPAPSELRVEPQCRCIPAPGTPMPSPALRPAPG